MIEPSMIEPNQPGPDERDAKPGRCVTAVVREELPRLVFRVELDNQQSVLAHAAGQAQKNFVRLRTGDRVQVELSPHDLSRGRILKKV
jgi:translation initiation factor IF-1